MFNFMNLIGKLKTIKLNMTKMGEQMNLNSTIVGCSEDKKVSFDAKI